MSEIEFASNSQAGQDLWAWEKLGKPNCGIFLDIGCGHPQTINNTYALEKLGWAGWLVDIGAEPIKLCGEMRSARAICADATQIDWRALGLGEARVDYLSLDIDDWTLAALENLLRHGVSFRVATIEHDAYRLGDKLRIPERELLINAGYVLDRADVFASGYPDFPFEDWWVHV